MDGEVWTVKLLLMSCRVMSKGVGMIMIHHVLRLAKEAGVKLRAEFVSNDRNRQMLITYSFAGFKEIEKHRRAGPDGERLLRDPAAAAVRGFAGSGLTSEPL